ncbi:helix-turn-helix domain-containing protein [Cognatishimia activa]|uniref:YSIRK-targeted surface antigen transcriptional regulator n=1 Tax=Cognatishimia activa TaxID=1715691 RepID=A0A0P1IMC7_9RHOB|nr:helix-turn-helix domain-containing protein [Cognatishimia activa]CUI35241.1 YSIRK-targeted surface antigen transcriptional regulator [Cognatishimia activa]CUK24708.1 YSIRK-targeted surface antigen transcriptional regulator [Cognatishimia activa]
MPVLPLPLVFALFLCVMLLQSALRGEGAGWLRVLLLFCAIQNVLIAFVHHYGVSELRIVLPITASIIPSFVWVAFKSTAVRSFGPADLAHIIPAVIVAFATLTNPALLDVLVPLVFFLYGSALLFALSRGEDQLHRVRLQHGSSPLFIWRGIAAVLLVSALSDVAIVADHILGDGSYTPWIVSFIGSVSVLALGALAMAKPIADVEENVVVSVAPEEQIEDAALMLRLDTLVREGELYLNPDLTLSMLSRRLSVPAKRLSTTINRETGQNVSRYINAFRIEHACVLLSAGKNVTQAMLESGFNTKSNFNREFLRVKHCTPSDWRTLSPAPTAA